VFEYDNYSWPRKVDRIFKIVEAMDGRYNEDSWKMLKKAYGTIHDHKKRRLMFSRES